MDFLKDYIILLVVGICLCVGYMIKNFIPSKKINRFIPLLMGILGLVVNIWINNFSFTPSVVLGGLASGLASTGMYELFKNFIEKGGNNIGT